jgi:hypothetical protein
MMRFFRPQEEIFSPERPLILDTSYLLLDPSYFLNIFRKKNLVRSSLTYSFSILRFAATLGQPTTGTQMAEGRIAKPDVLVSHVLWLGLLDLRTIR